MFQKYIYNTEGKYHINNLLLCFCLLSLVILFSSCEQDLSIEIKTNDKRLLVDGEFTNDTVVHSIRLYCSGSLITGKPQTIVSGAKIYVTDGIETFDYIENKDTLGLYQTLGKVGGKGGHNYTLSITNIDIDEDGKIDSYTANSLLPVPIKFDSLLSYRGYTGDGPKVINLAYYKLFFDGPGYVYQSILVNNFIRYVTITDRTGSGPFASFKVYIKVPKVLYPDSVISYRSFFVLPPSAVKNNDTISFICFNFTDDQVGFLKIFDNNTTNNTSGNNLFNNDNIYDQLRIPTNLPTNIEPADKTAGYFFIYSVSKISKVFNE
jgi:hypothetical protein